MEQIIEQELSFIFKNTVVPNNPTKLILSGGGLKGVAHLGCLYGLEKINKLTNINTYSGTSVGAIICVLLNIGYGPMDIYDIVKQSNISNYVTMQFKNIPSLISDYGMDDGDKIVITLKKLFQAKNINPNITFKELYDKTNKKLYICASKITNVIGPFYMSIDNEPNMKVLLALRMSFSIPFIFKPVHYEGNVYVDGGCMDNFPSDIIDASHLDSVGVYINNITCIKEINNVEDYILGVVQCISQNSSHKTYAKFKSYTYFITFNDLNCMETNININDMFNIGFTSVFCDQ